MNDDQSPAPDDLVIHRVGGGTPENLPLMPSRRFPQHGRLIHPSGAAGFTQENLERLAQCFTNETGL